MKKLALGTVMVLSLVIATGGVFAQTQLEALVPWFINDNTGVMGTGYDTWVQVKNITDDTITFYVDYYDDDDFTTVATTDTFVLVTQASEAYYTGKAARDYSMGTAGQKGTMNIRWDTVAGTNPPDDMRGYISVIKWGDGFSFATNFDWGM